ncbi:MAG: class I SAM-dependent methyltransferase [Magnetospirillum sp.]|nr:class I SAM-dependent methyltransferase [Magnetospirillum sp.]
MRHADRGLPFSASSFRDPVASTHVLADAVFRIVDEGFAAQLDQALALPGLRPFLDAGTLIATEPCPTAEVNGALMVGAIPAQGYVCYRHPRIAFPSYPYEWAPQMLHAAGRLTLDLARTLLAAGFGLKDATPFNVLFDGPRPVFIDVTSIERRRPSDPLWAAEGQFLRTILLPLLLERDIGLGLSALFLSHADGIDAVEAGRLLGRWRMLTGGAFGLVGLPALLSRRSQCQGENLYAPRDTAPDKARFILDHLIGRLARRLDALAPTAAQSHWTDYVDTRSYEDADVAAKAEFVSRALAGSGGRLLDVGCNTGEFSVLAARQGWSVVALDNDTAVAGRLWERAAKEGHDILPLVVDVAQPTPGTGLFNNQFPAFLARCDAAGGFDAVLMLAVIHHLMVTNGLPLRAVVDLAARLTRDRLILEIVLPDDIMFRKIARGRGELFAGLTRELVLAALAEKFDITGTLDLAGGGRCLVSCRRKGQP